MLVRQPVEELLIYSRRIIAPLLKCFNKYSKEHNRLIDYESAKY